MLINHNHFADDETLTRESMPMVKDVVPSGDDIYVAAQNMFYREPVRQNIYGQGSGSVVVVYGSRNAIERWLERRNLKRNLKWRIYPAPVCPHWPVHPQAKAVHAR